MFNTRKELIDVLDKIGKFWKYTGEDSIISLVNQEDFNIINDTKGWNIIHKANWLYSRIPDVDQIVLSIMGIQKKLYDKCQIIWQGTLPLEYSILINKNFHTKYFTIEDKLVIELIEDYLIDEIEVGMLLDCLCEKNESFRRIYDDFMLYSNTEKI